MHLCFVFILFLVKDIKPITIKVLDINDEPPVWKMDEPVPYTAVVDRDPRAGLLVFQFMAQDPDSQSQIVYTLHSKSPNTSRLIMKEGKLFTESGPPFQHDTYKILVSAHDSKAATPMDHSNTFGHYTNKSQEIFAELTIVVGKKAPQFYQSEYKVIFLYYFFASVLKLTSRDLNCLHKNFLKF